LSEIQEALVAFKEQRDYKAEYLGMITKHQRVKRVLSEVAEKLADLVKDL